MFLGGFQKKLYPDQTSELLLRHSILCVAIQLIAYGSKVATVCQCLNNKVVIVHRAMTHNR